MSIEVECPNCLGDPGDTFCYLCKGDGYVEYQPIEEPEVTTDE